MGKSFTLSIQYDFDALSKIAFVQCLDLILGDVLCEHNSIRMSDAAHVVVNTTRCPTAYVRNNGGGGAGDDGGRLTVQKKQRGGPHVVP